ncbi:unnamed protein product [Peniophora sp. CBMAI 1063]|nr:unnamed protein product [Peniophora sp. CBMAI 1063]
MNGPTEELHDQEVLATATGSDDLGHLAVGNVPQRPSTSATSPATRRRRRLGMMIVPGRGDLYDEMRAKKRQQRDDENISLAIGEPTASVHPRKRKATPGAKLTAAEQVVARTREQWTSATASCTSAVAYEEPPMVVVTDVNRGRENGTLAGSRAANVQHDEDVPMRSSDGHGHAKKSSGASASTVRLRPVKPYKIARPETADQWRIEAMQMVQSAHNYSEHNGYVCRRVNCEALLETVEALAEHLRQHDSTYTGGPAVKQCGRCGGMFETDNEIRMHKCRLGGRSSSPSKRSLLTMTLPQPVKMQIRKVKNVAQKCVAATRKLAPISRRYEPY